MTCAYFILHRCVQKIEFFHIYAVIKEQRDDIVIGIADVIENNDNKGITKYNKENLTQLKGFRNIVLGCTHYPLIKKSIQK